MKVSWLLLFAIKNAPHRGTEYTYYIRENEKCQTGVFCAQEIDFFGRA